MAKSTIAASLLLLSTANALYTSSSPVLQVNSKTYDSLINKSNHTSIVEFYAPWCGHCKNLAPHFEKAAKNLQGLAKVAAVDCDEESNKPLCGSMGVQGFPTLKIVKPGKKPGKPIVEDYQGARTAKAIVDAVVDKIPNHVKRLKDADYAEWVVDNTKPKAILFSNKGTVSALLKSVAIDFLDAIHIGQIRDKETDAVEAFNVEKFPTLVLIPGDGAEPITYDGEMKKDLIVKFLSQAASPNPDPPAKKEKPKKDKKASSASSKMAKSSASHKSEEAETASPDADETPKAQPPKQAPPKPAGDAKTISSLPDGLVLQQKCLNDKAGTSVIAILPEEDEPSAQTNQAVKSLSELHQKHENAKRKLFPFYQLPHSNDQGAALRMKLGLSTSDVEIVAINGKRGWWTHFPSKEFTSIKIEDWVDAIRMGDFKKTKIPDGLIVELSSLPAEQVVLEDPEPIKQKETKPGPDQEELKKMYADLKGQMPEGMDFEIEEIDDDEYEKIMKQGEKAEPVTSHDEL
ncbi:hypothetical protein AC579_7766 [Pseudocercospora musae]|uniref:protein disulfide-isomerase n=1 Tax=Pseudocercospora musae TaxID=113226 RepID=A0A139IJM0_9PEZI|nr:hypothetical protein AC579_7766 [Pseudocercospora musae]